MEKKLQIQSIKELIKLRERKQNQEMFEEVIKLPTSKYFDSTIFKREIETIFRHHPIVVGHTSHLNTHGSYLLSDWDEIPYIVVRDNEGQLRAYINMCRHRGAKLVVSDQHERLSAFTCPFHGWRYDLNGELQRVTRKYNFPNLDKCKYGLKELPVTEYAGLIWIYPQMNESIDIQSFLGEFANDLKYFEIDKMIRFRKNKVIRNANWKLLIKTYLEGYHVPFLHKDTLSRSFKHGVIAYKQQGPHIRLIAARTNIMDAIDVDENQWNILDYASVYYSFFPNTFFIMHPDYVSINTFFPLAPNKTIWTHEMLYYEEKFRGEEGRISLEKRFRYTNDTVFDQEDFEVAVGVQQGFNYYGDEYHTLGLEEGLLALFQINIDAAMR